MKTTIAVFLFIRAYIKQRQCPPSYREIAEGVGLKQPTSVIRHLDRLEQRGLIARFIGENGRARYRTLWVTDAGWAFKAGDEAEHTFHLPPEAPSGSLESMIHDLEALLARYD